MLEAVLGGAGRAGGPALGSPSAARATRCTPASSSPARWTPGALSHDHGLWRLTRRPALRPRAGRAGREPHGPGWAPSEREPLELVALSEPLPLDDSPGLAGSEPAWPRRRAA